MDPIRFDRLARTLGGAVSRRGALAALAGLPSLVGLVGGAEGRKRRRGEKTKRRDGQHRGRDRRRAPRRARAEAAVCCGSGACAPGPGKNLQKCCYQGQDLTGRSFKGANLGSANFSGATLTGANMQGANLGKACLVDTILTNARINDSTNLGGAIFCRTQTDAGEDNSGCDRGTPCCPTCDEVNTCDPGEVCCRGRCRGCCTNDDCPDQERPICRNHVCSPGCEESTPCDSGQRCCNGTCRDLTWTPRTTFGSEGGPDVQLQFPGGVEVSEDGLTAWVAGSFQHRISVWTRPNAASDAWAHQVNFGSGPSSDQARFNQPTSVAVSADTLTAWVVDRFNNRISVWTRPHAGSTAWTHQVNFGGAGAGGDQFNLPTGIAVADDGLTAWVADELNHRVSVWTRPNAGSIAWSNQAIIGSGPGSGDDEFRFPNEVAVSGDGLTAWVTDRNNARVSVWTRPNGSSAAWEHRVNFPSGPANDDEAFGSPLGVAVSADTLTVWVGDIFKRRVSVWTRPTAGSMVWTHQVNFGSQGTGPAEFEGLADVDVANDGETVWVVDSSLHRVSVWGLGCPA